MSSPIPSCLPRPVEEPPAVTSGNVVAPRFSKLLGCVNPGRPSVERRPDDAAADPELSAEKVAGLIAGVPLIGMARAALERAGCSATIAGNRITVNDEVCAQYIPSNPSPTGAVDPYWVVYALSGATPVWIVGGEDQK